MKNRNEDNVEITIMQVFLEVFLENNFTQSVFFTL